MNPTQILTAALREVAGAALVLDADLRIVAFTDEAADELGHPPELGVPAPKILCGHGEERPVAEALAAGRAVSAEILRPDEDGQNYPILVRATPLRGDEGQIVGHLLLLHADHEGRPDGRATESFGIVTRDARMKQLLRDVRKVAASQSSVLVRGESGTGKELIARAIHDGSSRADGPFRAINCAALPATLLESELFGHSKGSFTGATRDAPGHFRLADGGTLFLDEVAELPPEVQAKLLRVLQERAVLPIGGTAPISVDVRIVSATHRALRKEVEAGRFRADLLYRLRVIPLYLPALRERPQDIELLARHFLEQHPSAKHVDHIAPGALEALVAYDWPGNVRELQNAIEYATVMGSGRVLTAADLPPEIRGEQPGTRSVTVPDSTSEDTASDLSPEGRRLVNALERNGGHMGRAAASLGISRTTLWRRLKRLGIDREDI
ncbi:MAG: sigma 54-interacting transcriptional regulator [Deltaproteobacteria bacterium]|nr:sigma 54-interacting transcriptional regulator [Deltaproteobacteria bacterium]